MSNSVKVWAVVLRNKLDNSIINIYPIADWDDSVIIVYPREHIPTIDDLQAAIKNFGDVTKKEAYFRYMENEDIVLEDDAKHMPSIGNIIVKIEEKTVEWE